MACDCCSHIHDLRVSISHLPAIDYRSHQSHAIFLNGLSFVYVGNQLGFM